MQTFLCVSTLCATTQIASLLDTRDEGSAQEARRGRELLTGVR